MDGILSEETFKRLQEQAQADRQVSDLSSLRKETIPGLERDAKLLSKYVELAKTGVRNRYRGDKSTVPAAERLWYAEQAAMLQPSIEKRVQAAGLIPSVQEQPVAQQVQASSQQPQPTAQPEAPAQPSANAPAPAPDKPKYDPFAEFNNYEKTRKKFFSIAFKYVSQVPIQYQDEALKLVKEEWDNTGPSLPKSTLLPLKHPATGEILKDQALTADGRIVELKTPPAEKALTEAQEKNLKFAGAMHRANKEYENLVRASGYDPSNPLNRLPMFEMLKTQNRKLYEGIVNEFTNAINRDQSGASVTPAEFQAAERRYFPLAGDTEEVLKAKEARRKEMVASMYDLVPEYARDKIPSYGTNQQQQSAPGAGGGFYFNTKTGRMEPR